MDMSHPTTRRIVAIMGSFAVIATVATISCTEVATAGPRPSVVAGHAVAHNAVTVPLGTDNLYLNNGSGFAVDGTMTVKSDGTWSTSAFPDAGSWAVVGKDIILSDSSGGAIWFAAVGKHGLASARKPGTITSFGSSSSTGQPTFYTLG